MSPKSSLPFHPANRYIAFFFFTKAQFADHLELGGSPEAKALHQISVSKKVAGQFMAKITRKKAKLLTGIKEKELFEGISSPVPTPEDEHPGSQ